MPTAIAASGAVMMSRGTPTRPITPKFTSTAIASGAATSSPATGDRSTRLDTSMMIPATCSMLKIFPWTIVSASAAFDAMMPEYCRR
ncbi:MAG: hypothetical protein E6J72_17400 [Deltaproteobacteria bacterium]|nr:MAG: hypothetical protein E6J72_17400 [Deltaproteobacteria bacterium]